MDRIDDAPTDRLVDPPPGAVDDQPTDEIAVAAPAAPARRRRVLAVLAELVETKTGHASGHGERVSVLAAGLAAAAGLDGEAAAAVEEASLVHDVGEMLLAPALLGKRLSFTEHDRQTMRRHVAASVQIARRAQLPAAVLAAVRHHHERWDGRGHPDGLRGEAIPLGARIVAVADRWDALATARPQRRALSIERAVAELASLAGNLLDSTLVALFLNLKLHELIDWSQPPRAGLALP